MTLAAAAWTVAYRSGLVTLPYASSGGPVTSRSLSEGQATRHGQHYANTPLRTLPSCANTLVVPSGSDVKLKPCAFEADHVIVA